MFSFASTPVTFVGLLLLFAWCTAWCLRDLAASQTPRQRVSTVLHLAMAVVMLLMVAGPTWRGLTSLIPTWWLAGLFAVFTGWFVWRAIEAARSKDRAGLTHLAGHATMFAAMTWHLSAMAAMSSAMTAPMGHDMPGMEMDMGAWMQQQSRPGGMLWWFALVGLPLMAYLLLAGLGALRRAVRPAAPAARPEPALVGAAVSATAPAVATATHHGCQDDHPFGSPRYRLAAAADAAMNLGMFWMSVGLMVPILPFLALLAV